MNGKRLYRTLDDKKLGGVCGGLGEYFEIDPTLIRLLFVVLDFTTGIVPGIILYFLATMIIPDAPKRGE